MTSSLYDVNISFQALKDNLALLSKDAISYTAVIKADAYGHGLVETAKAILSSSSKDKLYSFAVGSICEGVKLKKENLSNVPILAMLGAVPNNTGELHKAKEADLTVLVHNKEGLQDALENNISFAVKWNTGMNRFGFGIDEIPSVLDYIKSKENARFELNLSHLATAEELDDFEESLVQHQMDEFSHVAKGIIRDFPKVKFSFGQSAHVLKRSPNKRDIVRIGVSMYGINPFYGTKEEELGSKLKAVMSVCAPIVALNTLEAGESLSYGHKFCLKKKSEIAIIPIGYADGYRRQYFTSVNYEDEEKNVTIQAMYKGRRISLVGSVCMQVALFDVSGLNAQLGDKIYLLGGESENAIKAEELSAWWGTIAYEPLCQLAKNIERKYI